MQAKGTDLAIKSSYNELVVQHMALEDKCKSMESAVKLKEERPDSSLTLES